MYSLDSFGLAKRDDFLNIVLTEKPYEIQTFLENAIPIWEEYYSGPDHLETAHGHDQLAQLAANRGDPLKAETHWQQALPIFKIWLGVEHPITQQIHCALQEIKLA